MRAGVRAFVLTNRNLSGDEMGELFVGKLAKMKKLALGARSGFVATSHLVAGPYRVYKAHRDHAERTLALLCGPPSEVSALYRELASRQELVTNPSVVGAATLLYYDASKHRVKRGADPRRFAEVLMQLDVVWDLYSMTADELIAMLPSEFDRFRRTAEKGEVPGQYR